MLVMLLFVPHFLVLQRGLLPNYLLEAVTKKKDKKKKEVRVHFITNQPHK